MLRLTSVLSGTHRMPGFLGNLTRKYTGASCFIIRASIAASGGRTRNRVHMAGEHRNHSAAVKRCGLRIRSEIINDPRTSFRSRSCELCRQTRADFVARHSRRVRGEIYPAGMPQATFSAATVKLWQPKLRKKEYITRLDCSRQPAGTAMDHLCMRQAEKRLRNGRIRRPLSREFDLRDIKLHPAKPSGEKVFQHALSMQNAAGHKGRALRVIRQRPCRRCEARQFSRLALYCEAEPGSYTRTQLMCSCHAMCACLRYPAFVQIASAVQELRLTQQMAGSKVVHATKVVASREHFVYSFKRGMRVRSNEGGDNERHSYITIPTWTLYHRVALLVTHINRISGSSLMYSASQPNCQPDSDSGQLRSPPFLSGVDVSPSTRWSMVLVLQHFHLSSTGDCKYPPH